VKHTGNPAAVVLSLVIFALSAISCSANVNSTNTESPKAVTQNNSGSIVRTVATRLNNYLADKQIEKNTCCRFFLSAREKPEKKFLSKKMVVS
jgi:biopolymer transport protein ExbD